MSLKPHPIPHGAIRVPVPDTTQQTDYSCGASCLQAICKYYGIGAEDEPEYVESLCLDRRIGSHPFQIKQLAGAYKFRMREYCPMSAAQLRRELDWRHPVMMMIQAWGQEKVGKYWRWRRDYSNEWADGHWVVAIGYDRAGVFFEDPSYQAVRGWLSYQELCRRWHDTGRHRRYVRRYGLALWRPHRGRSAYESRAQWIG